MLSTVYEFILKAREEDKENPISINRGEKWSKAQSWSIDSSGMGWTMSMKRTDKCDIEFDCNIDRVINNQILASTLYPLCQQMKRGLVIENCDSETEGHLYNAFEEDQKSPRIITVDTLNNYLNSHPDDMLSFEFTLDKRFWGDTFYNITVHIHKDSINVLFHPQQDNQELGDGWQLDTSTFVVMMAANIIEKSNFGDWYCGLNNILTDYFNKDISGMILKFI